MMIQGDDLLTEVTPDWLLKVSGKLSSDVVDMLNVEDNLSI